jgi:hypothetical protein
MVEKYKKFVLISVLILSLIINLILLDLYILPKKTIKDKIVFYKEISINRKHGGRTFIGYNFLTNKGFEFSTERYFINEDSISICYTTIFKNITKLKSDKKDYSDKLISDLNSIIIYFYLILFISLNSSVLLLFLDKNISKNRFQNIIGFNSIMLFFILILYIYF